MSSSFERMHAGATVAVLHVKLKSRVGKEKILGNDILTVFICLEVALQILHSSLFKRDPRNVNSSFERMHAGVTVAVLHVNLKTRLGETKKLGNEILSPSNCVKVIF